MEIYVYKTWNSTHYTTYFILKNPEVILRRIKAVPVRRAFMTIHDLG